MIALEFLLYFFGAIAAWWIACRFRLCPVVFMRFWYGLCFLFTLISLNLSTLAVVLVSRFLKLYPKITAGRICMVLTSIHFKVFAFMTPHIRYIPLYGAKTDKVFSDASSDKRHLVCWNHTSFNDGFAGMAIAPSDLCWNIRTVYKRSLNQIPLWGSTYARRNDFAVYFTSNDKFTTDKEKQAAETLRMEEWVTKEDGGITLFPEGQINKDPFTIQTIRFGMIKFAREHKMPIYICVQDGSYTSWPVDAPIGGFPADIFYTNRKLDAPGENETVEETAARLQKVMQEMVDEIREFRKKKNV
jgi:1-acyl-sn-glycerol-3-phosphate acyltransferase